MITLDQYKCAVISGGVSVNFTSDMPLLELFNQSGYTRHFPDFHCVDQHLSTSYLVHYRNGEEMTVEYSGSTAILSFPWGLMRKGETILYAAYPFIERQLQGLGIVTAHAAAVTFGQDGIIIIGKIGAGKTSTAMELCRKHGAKLIANDLCLVGGEDECRIMGGTKDFHVRLESARRNLPDLVRFFSERPDLDSWSNKVVFDPIKLGIQLQDEPVPLRKVVLVHVDQSQKRLTVQPKSDLVLRLLLNENFSRYIRSTTTTLMGGDSYDLLGYIPSMDSPELFEKRRRLINHILSDLGVIYVSGRVEEVVDAIAHL